MYRDRRFSLLLTVLAGTWVTTMRGVEAPNHCAAGESPFNKNVVTSKSSGMKFAWIPAGSFAMGSLLSETGHTRSEDQHIVRITSPFFLGVTEVTQAEFDSLMKTNPSAFAKSGTDAAVVSDLETGRFPVENVSWYGAVEFCNKLSAKDGLPSYYSLTAVDRDDDVIKSAIVKVNGGAGYRLPTEAEWEYACRAGTTSAYHSGDSTALLNQSGWFGPEHDHAGNSDKHTHPVATKRSNDFGLYDMHGNVAEWCQDWYDYTYYERTPTVNPLGPVGGSMRIIRGGSWNVDPLKCRSASRAGAAPNQRSNDIGFRVARTHLEKTVAKKRNGNPPYRIVVTLRDGNAVDLYRNESFDTVDAAKQRLADSKLYGRTGNIQIIDANGENVE